MTYVLSAGKILRGLWGMNNCNLTTWRYNADEKWTNDGNREECVEISKLVLCLEREEMDIEKGLKQIA